MSLAQPPSAYNGTPPQPPTSPAADCPLGTDWHRWDVLNAGARLSVLPTRNAPPVSASGGAPLKVQWSPPTLHFAGHRTLRHSHGEFDVMGIRVHVDWVTMDAWGPGRSLVEARVFVNGELRGYAAEGGCSLGSGTACYFPAVARISPGFAVTVDRDEERRPHARLFGLGGQ